MTKLIVDMRDISKVATITVRLKHKREFHWRTEIALWLIRLAVYVAWFGIEVE